MVQTHHPHVLIYDLLRLGAKCLYDDHELLAVERAGEAVAIGDDSGLALAIRLGDGAVALEVLWVTALATRADVPWAVAAPAPPRWNHLERDRLARVAKHVP